MSKKTFKCIIKIPGFYKTNTGKVKHWRTDKILTFCCSTEKCYFVWEKNTKFNNYEGYSGYFNINDLIII